MNIFTVLSQGDSSVREVSMSAMLAYFLDPAKDHGLGDVFLRMFLQLHAMREHVPGTYTLSQSAVQPEQKLGGGNKVDIGITLRDDEEEIVRHVIIENKINLASVREDQLVEYYKAARANDEFRGPMTVVFLTPAASNPTMDKAFAKLVTGSDDYKVRLRWKDENGGESIQKAIREGILRRESLGEISPINEYVKHTLKAFAMHLDNLPYGGRVARKSSSSPVIGSDENTVEIRGYNIAKDGNKFIVRDKNGDKVPALPVFRKFIKELEISSTRNEEGEKWTTFTLGNAVLRKLKEAARKNEESDGGE